MTKEEIELEALKVRNNKYYRSQFCEDVGITENEYFEKRCGDFTIEDMIRAFKNGKAQGELLKKIKASY